MFYVGGDADVGLFLPKTLERISFCNPKDMI
jgi:hypothetical protein